jgi:hypothetical protein
MSQRAKTHYDVLLVHPDAPLEIIRASYRTLMQRLKAHPDLGGDHAAAAEINAAYAVLKDSAQRAAYDMELALRANHASTVAAAAETRADAQRPMGSAASPVREEEWGACVFCGLVPRWRPDSNAGYAQCARCASPLTRLQLLERQDGDPQRGVYRIGKREPMRIYLDWQDRRGLDGSLLDVSLSGLRFVVGTDLAQGVKVRIDSGICAAVARIAHRGRDAGGQGWQFGAEFLTVAFKRQRGSLLSVGA